jgi:hypothetical protein
MMSGKFSDYTLSGIVFLVVAVILLVIATVTNRSDITSATLFLSGVGCFMGGILLITFSFENPVDPVFTGLMIAGASENIPRLCSDLGVRGDAWFIPADGEGGPVWQFVALTDKIPGQIRSDFSFYMQDDASGVLIVPAALPLIDHLRGKHGLAVQTGDDGVFASVREVCEDVIESADKVKVFREGDAIIASIEGYRLYAGCRFLMQESPKCCTMNPCGICSLISCMLALGLQKPVSISHISGDHRKKALELVFITGNERLSRDEGPGSSG